MTQPTAGPRRVQKPGAQYYGRTDTDQFKAQFPRGFAPLYQLAKSFGCRLGGWLGPDGFGDTPAAELAGSLG